MTPFDNYRAADDARRDAEGKVLAAAKGWRVAHESGRSDAMTTSSAFLAEAVDAWNAAVTATDKAHAGYIGSRS